ASYVLGRHIVGLRLQNDGAQPRIHVRVATAGASRDGQFLDEAREDLAALGVSSTLLVFDGVPLGMAGHEKNPRKYVETDRSLYNGLPGQNDPHIGPCVPPAAAVVAKKRGDFGPRALEPPRPLRHRESAQRER